MSGTKTTTTVAGQSANDTVLTAGSTAAITDASGDLWTITGGGQVAVNGTADTTTANVTELAYVNGTIWQENASGLWWGETAPDASWAPEAGTATSPLPASTATAAPPAATGVIGSGSDTIVLTMSGDADGPAGAVGADAEFTLNVDGQQIGGLETVTASHAAGQTETFTFEGNYAPGPHAITITFVNNSMTAGDKAAFNDGGDRNLYVNSVAYDGTTVSSTVTPIYQSAFYPPLNTGAVVYGNAVFAVTDTTAIPAGAPSTPTTTPGAVSVGSGTDTLTLAMSEDPYDGNAEFTVSVDGVQVGGTLTTSAIEWEGQTQQFVLKGSWGNGPHTVAITYLNDLIGPADAAGGYDPVDRNLVINGISYDGTTVAGTPYELFNDGTQSFSVPATTAPVETPPVVTPPVVTPPVVTPPVVTPPVAKPSANDTVVNAGSAAAITDASGNLWTITSGDQVAVNGKADTTTANVTELAYVNGTIWQENASKLWWGETSPTASWAPGAGTVTSPLPATTPPVIVPPVVTPSANDTVVKAGLATAITDASGNLWTITSGGQVAVNGTADTTTAHVTELAYVNKTIWQENTSNLWYSEAKPGSGWSAGTTASPLGAAAATVTIAATEASATVSQSNVSVVATSGAHMLFLSGTGDTVNLTGGSDTITETGNGNTFVLPPAGKGYDTFTSNVLTTGDTLDLRPALAATTWNGATATLAKYLTVADSAQGAVLSVAPASGAAGVAIATIDGAATLQISDVLAHALT